MSPAPDTAAGGSAGWGAQVGLQPGAPAPAKGTEASSLNWTALEITAKVTAQTVGRIFPAARLETSPGGIVVVRLRGLLKVVAAQEITPSSTFANVPAALAPAFGQAFFAAVAEVGVAARLLRLLVEGGSGALQFTAPNENLKEGNLINLDGITFPLV